MYRGDEGKNQQREPIATLTEPDAPSTQTEGPVPTGEVDEASLRLFVGQSPTAMALFDHDMCYIAASPRWVSDYRLDGKNLIGRSYYEIFSEIPEHWKQVHRRCLAGASEKADEEKFDRGDGISQWICWEVRPWYTAKNQIGGLIIFSEDITRRKIAEETLRLSEKHYQMLIERCPEAVFVSRAGTIVFANATMVRILAAPNAAAILGHTVFDFLHPAYHQAIRERMAMLLATQCPNPPTVQQWRRFDGGLVDVEGVAGPIIWDGNRANLVMLRDVSEIAQLNARIQNLMASTQDAVICIDDHARTVMFNSAAEKIFGYTKDEIVGEKVNLLMAEPYAKEHDGYIKHYESTGEARVIGRVRTVVGKRKNGEEFPVEISVTRLVVGKEVHYTAFVRDVSERIRMQQELLQKERLAAVGATVAKFAHEIGNPINGMYMTAQLLQRRLAQAGVEDDTLLTPFKSMVSEIKRLDNLLSEFRTSYRESPSSFKPTSIGAVVRSVLALERPKYSSQGIRVQEAISEDLPTILADDDKLKQAVLNLCKNGVEAMAMGGTLRVVARRDGGDAIIEVSDTGNGVPPGINVFEAFKTTKPGGTGLGLFIARQIVTMHEGSLTYQSVADKGTTFMVRLPVVDC